MKKSGESSPLIAFTGGGTGGHIYPGLAIVQALRNKGYTGRILWIGSNKDSDRQIVESEGIEFRPIQSGKLRRSFSLKNLADAFRVLAGYVEARRILLETKPGLLFSKGGYVSVPPCRAASSLGIPYFTHESDVSPGLATRLNAVKAEKILVSWESGTAGFSDALKAKTEIVGNPVRPGLLKGDANRGRALLGIQEGLPVVLCLGGSQGSRQINELVASLRPVLHSKAFIIHQTGKDLIDEVKEPKRDDYYTALPYIGEEMRDYLTAATVVLGRAGAGTLWESAALGKPMVLIPLTGTGTRGDQVENAAMARDAGAALSFAGDEAKSEAVIAAVVSYLEDPAMRAKAEAASLALSRVRTPDGSKALSADYIADLILARQAAIQGGSL